ncbi:methyltransferase domain-containing protein [bacterium]|nr:methyltransferase domain-containing protein [bacterium]
MKSKILYLGLLLMAVSCKSKHEPNAAQNHMNSSSFEELVARFNDPERAEWQKVDEVLDALQLDENDVVADVGAGTGYFTLPLAGRCKHVVATDIDKRFVDYINNEIEEKGISNVEVRLTTTNEPGLNELECDKIITVNTVHHFEKLAKFLSKLRDGLRIGGTLYIIDFKEGDLPVGPPANIKLSLSELKRNLGLAGFSKVEVDENSLPYQFILKAY